MLKFSDFYLDKQKSFIPKKNIPWIALFSANRWRLDVLTFLIKGFGGDNEQIGTFLYIVDRLDYDSHS